MIPVVPKPEPADFGHKVRDRGMSWLEKNGLPAQGPLPEGSNPKPYWRECVDDLYKAYDGVCAYLAVFFERSTGGTTVEHFIPKSLHAEAIYEWSNYRLASSIVNARKRDHEGIIDPFFLAPKTFFLEFVTGSIYPNPALREPELSLASATIDILGLDDPMHREMRARHFLWCKQGLISPDYLERMSPFVYSEARRQGLL